MTERAYDDPGAPRVEAWFARPSPRNRANLSALVRARRASGRDALSSSDGLCVFGAVYTGAMRGSPWMSSARRYDAATHEKARSMRSSRAAIATLAGTMRRRAKAIVKFGLARVAPSLTLTLLSIRSRRLIERQARDLGLAECARRLAAAAGSVVQSGPFAGMRLDVEALPVHVAPKLLGTYENELHPAIEAAISRKPEVILNVGCAEGYYAVGFALRLPEATVHAFDADPKARRATARNAALNRVGDRVHAAGVLQAEGLEPFLRLGRALVVMDCEGAEAHLLDPLRAPSLVAANILVEVHPGVAPEAGATITDRFAATHAANRIEQAELQERVMTAPPVLSIPDLRIAVDERRDEDIFWLVLVPRPQAVADDRS